ncbi:hypothetical protein BH11PSE1_BH11PSE1_18040 [soil metagenome]
MSPRPPPRDLIRTAKIAARRAQTLAAAKAL